MNETITASKLVKAFGKEGAVAYATTKAIHFTKFQSIANQTQANQWRKIARLISEK